MCRKKSSGKSDIAVSANMAYGEMKLEPRGGIGGGDGVYEDPDKMANTGQGNYEPMARYQAAYQSTTSQPAAPVYATADETTS